jgi:hypothetical protein
VWLREPERPHPRFLRGSSSYPERAWSPLRMTEYLPLAEALQYRQRGGS